MTYLPDINVWIALTVAEHVQHSVAKRWFDTTADDTVVLCRVTQMGFLRLLTNVHVMAQDVFTAEQAWHLLEQLGQDDRVVFVPEPPAIDQRWRAMTAGHKSGTNFWTDTYLAAFAQISDYTFVTFDRGFKKHKRLSMQLLTAGH
jgi:toxin-antitoxin system PIN domain toxin